MSVRVSPGGALLRTSRLFSIPKPIANAPGDSINNKDPNIGTTVHPTHQAIATYPQNKVHGDWGLKRSLPLRQTQKATAVRVKAIDSREMVTDYASASEHTVTVQKFQELGMPLTMPTLPTTFGVNNTSNNVSVFEEATDFTPDPTKGATDTSRRWKFNGPWLAGMSEGQFNQYLRKTVRARRPQFKAFLKERFAADANVMARQTAIEKGAPQPKTINPEDIGEIDYTERLRKLRADRVTLFSYVSEFLDLAPISPPSARSSVQSGAGSRIAARSPNPYAERGPPPMHPSGGLSYLRTFSHVENHPVYGPQAEHTPALTRIIHPKATMATPPRIGIAGFITVPPVGDSNWTARNNRSQKPKIPGLAWFDPSIPGGPKALTAPTRAYMDSQGKVILRVEHASDVAQLIAKELVGEADVYNKKPSELALEGAGAGAGASTYAAPRFRYTPLAERKAAMAAIAEAAKASGVDDSLKAAESETDASKPYGL
ncbi:mitochondrial ribosomal protein MRP51 [Plectosphaerella plurivora]|uniref:Mitochondrial ribosomal protein MRP51 n=1 Tax=Plectosphaerella plurivora TaxID=936078 RepID=A0A9P9A9E6_9PEZI|nr:mitochondrial ribosomal protein MRP51 [Plectosphaerella plurivora]